MKKNLHGKIVLSIAISLFAFAGHSQVADKNVKQKLTDEKGLPTFIAFNETSPYKAVDFQQVFKAQLGLKENSSFSKIKSEPDLLGFVHEKFQLFHRGIKVEFATYTLHSKSGRLESMSGEFYNLENVNTTSAINKEQAFNRALLQIGAKQYLWDSPEEAAAMNYRKPAGELVLLPIDGSSSDLRLAYKFDIYATSPLSRGDIYIDAVTGNVLFYNATIKHLGEFSHGHQKSILSKTSVTLVAANAATRYSGTQSIQTTLSGTSYILADAVRGSGINTFNMRKGSSYTSAVNFTDVDNNWTAAEYANTNKDNGALDAHWGAEKTYDYWLTVHGRNSYDNAGAVLKSYVHYSTAYDNAFWNGSVMTYGDGSDTYFDILTSIDVAGHEIGHAVCERTANLAYQKESGAMNEGLSDIWGACIEYFAAPNKSRWLIGEDIERRPGHLALRSMSNPKNEGQPDTYGGINWRTVNCTPTSSNDYCGVHTNSGVLNHWFYILTDGKIGTNDIGSSYNVTGIGIDKSAKITFRMESVYMTSGSTYANARTYGIQSATDLYGAGSPEVVATTNAFYAVGVGAAYSGPGDVTAPSTPLNLVASGTTSTSTNLAWSASTDNVAVTGYNVYRGTTLVTTVTGLTYSVTGLTAGTAYAFTVKAKDAAGNLSLASNTASITTSGSAISYCTSKGNIVTDEFIDYVGIGGIANVTAANAGYGNFTGLTGNVPYGTNTIILSVGYTGFAYREYWGVWIDYNKNGTFESSEKVVASSTTSSSNLSYAFTVPTSALAGTTRMRVSMKYGSTPAACGNFTYGEVEDYTVNIGGTPFDGIDSTLAASSDDENSEYDFIIFPNPANESLNIRMADSRAASFKVFNNLGQPVIAGQLTENAINISRLSSGAYIFEIYDGQKTISKKFIKR